MGLLSRALVTASLFSATSLGAARPVTEVASRAKTEPCAEVAAAQAKQLESDPSATIFFVPAKLAYECLETVPFKKNDALRLIDGLGAFWKWQSTIDYLKDPPEGYMMPAVDLRARITEIHDKVLKEEYPNEYVFQDDMHELAVSVHDSHFNLRLDALDIFVFRRDNIGPIVSVSSDGKELPEIYAYYDLKKYDGKGNWKPSPIKKIDGKDAVPWLTELSYQGSSQDPDALYNELFYSRAGETVGGLGGFFGMSGEYTGPTTTLEFANGTKREYENLASFGVSLDGIKDGESFYDRFCNGNLATGPALKKRDLFLASPRKPFVKRAPSESPRPGYPTPVVEHSSGEVAGYFLEGSHGDTAVLSISGFMGDSDLMGFSETIEKFLAECAKKRKSKLIIDVTSNGGGAIFLGYDAFKQLFPKAPIDDAFNFRYSEQLDLLGDFVNNYLTDPETRDKPTADVLRGTTFDINAFLDMDNKKFKNWDAFVGPETNDADRGDFTELARWNLNDEATTRSGEFVVSGFLNRTDLPPQVFKAEDIILLTDGTCASTCTIFANLLKKNGVKSIVAGGRPRDGAVQAIGGVKGSNVLSFSVIYTYVSIVMDLATDRQRRELEGTEIGTIYRDGPYVLGRSAGDGEGARVNVRNAVDPNDKKRVPTQFVYEPADCRIWVTPEMTLDITALWNAVVDAGWGHAECTPGSRPE
ncbi:hypothetical protein VTO42DRAFT_7013 [Malbranchea cinnamomea]